MSESGSANAQFSWSEFDSEAYFNHYYGEPHSDDDEVIKRACAAMKAARPKTEALRTIDVGTGPNLFPLFCALPRAENLVAWEYSESNVRWLNAELEREPLRPQWAHFWNVARTAYGPDAHLPDNPIPELRLKTEVRKGSVYDLPERQWDAATMFFCAESITGKHSEFETACRRFARCVRPGGALIAAFLVGSSHYAVSERPFPILKISAADIEEVFSPISTDRRIEQIGIVEREIRSGYSGMAFLTAQAI